MELKPDPERLLAQAEELAAEVERVNRRGAAIGRVAEQVKGCGFSPSRGKALTDAGRHYITIATKVQNAAGGPAEDVEAISAAVRLLPQLRARGAKVDGLLAQVRAEVARGR